MNRLNATTWCGIGCVFLTALLGAGCAVPSTGDGDDTTSITASPERANADGHGEHKGCRCSPDHTAKLWAHMDEDKISLSPSEAALLDLAGHGGQRITLADAEDKLCEGIDLGDLFGDGSDVYAFGTNQEVLFDNQPPTGQVVFVTLLSGYTGALRFHSADDQDQYTISLDSEVMKNGAPFQLDWDQEDVLDAEVDALHRGLVATFSPTTPPPAPGMLCTDTGECEVIQLFDTSLIWFTDLGLALWTDSPFAAQPTASTVNRIDLF